MNSDSSSLAAVFAQCDSHGIQLSIAADGKLTIGGPKEAMTPDLLDLLKARKAGILLVLRADSDFSGIDYFRYEWDWLEAPAPPAGAVCPCGSTTWHDVSIHDGQSVRRDCGECERFIEFPIWYGTRAGQFGQQPLGYLHGKQTNKQVDRSTTAGDR